MDYRKAKSPSLRKLLAGLAAVSIILFLVPTSWTGGLIGLIQIIVPLQDASTAVVDSVAGAAGDAAAPIDPAEFDAARQQAAALAHQTAALSVRVQDLERQVQELTATRSWDAGGLRIGSRGRLIPARVVVGDIHPWRSSQLVTTGSLQGVRPGAAVLTNSFDIEADEDSGLQPGMAILLSEAFVGWVEKVSSHVSRVKLLSDPSVQMKVRIGRIRDGVFVLAEGYLWIVGRGGAAMEIRDVEARLVQSAAIEVGDVVLSDSTQEMLPASLTIGHVAAVLPDRDNPLFVHLAVKPVLDPTQLDRVYVFDPQPEAQP